MAKLNLVDVKCLKKQDTVGPDFIHIHAVGKKGVKHLASATMGKTDVHTLASVEPYPFEGSIEIEVIEVDGQIDSASGGSNDESLGKWTVTEAQAGSGILTGFFDRLSGADYHVRYTVAD